MDVPELNGGALLKNHIPDITGKIVAELMGQLLA